MSEPDPSASLRDLIEIEALDRALKQGGAVGLLAALDEGLAETPVDAEVVLADGSRQGRSALEAIRAALILDRSHLERHPIDLFQCLWNRLYWHDAAEAEGHYEGPGPWASEGPKVSALAERWRAERADTVWLRSLRPPAERLESAESAQVLRGNVCEVGTLALSPDARKLAAGAGGHVWVWDVQAGELCHTLDLEEAGEIRGVAFSPDGRRLATGTRDHTARVWDLETEGLLWEAGGHEGQVTSAAFSPDGASVAIGNLGWTARVYDSSGTEQTVYQGHRQSVLAIAFAPSGDVVVSAASDGTLQAWDPRTGARLAILGEDEAVAAVEAAEADESVYGDALQELAFSPEGSQLAACLGAGVRVWNTVDWSEATRLEPGGGNASRLGWLADGRLAVACWESLEVWDVASGTCVESEAVDPRKHPSAVTCFFADGRVARSAREGCVRVYALGQGASAGPQRVGEDQPVLGLDVDPVSARVVARVGEDYAPTRSLLDVDSGALTTLPALPQEGLQSLPRPVVCPASLRVLGASEPGYGEPPEYAVFDLQQGAPVSSFEANGLTAIKADEGHYQREFFFHPDGRRVIAVHHRKLGVWDGLTGALLGVFGWDEDDTPAAQQGIETVRLACGGRLVLAMLRPQSYAGEATVGVWSLESGKRLAELQVGEGRLAGVAVSPDGQLAASARSNGKIYTSDLTDEKRGGILYGEHLARALAFSPDGARLAAGASGAIRVWNLASGEVERELVHKDWLEGLSWVADGLVAAGSDSLVVWDPQTGKKRRGKLPRVAAAGTSAVWVASDASGSAVYRGLAAKPIARLPERLADAYLVGGDRIVGVERSTQQPVVYALEGADCAATRVAWSEPQDPVPLSAASPPTSGGIKRAPGAGLGAKRSPGIKREGGSKPKGFQRF